MTLKAISPIQVIPRSIGLMLTGRTTYPQQRAGQVITLDDGRQYRVFREVIMRTNPPRDTGAVFRVWFRTKMSIHQTMAFSLLTRIGFVGMPGFRGKMWLVNEETGEFGGIYQFDTLEDARHYQRSFAMRFSKWRSKRGCFTTEVYEKAGENTLFRPQKGA